MGGCNLKVIFAALLLACAAHASDEASKIATGISSFFAREFFKQFESQSNVAVSPTSAFLALSMAQLGAKGQTRKDISKGLGLPENEDNTKGFSDLLTELTAMKDARVVVANRIYIEDKSSLNSEFNVASKNKFKATAEKIDFASPTAAEQINNWIRNATRNRITEIVSKGTLNNGETKLMLMNVLYFRSPWQYKFYSPSEPRPFYVEENKSVDAQFMSQEDYFGYADLKDLDAELIEIPYKEKDFKFVVILPKQKVSLQQLEKKIAALNFLDLLADIKQREITMHLPKFQIEVTASLNDPLEKMGFASMFTDSADFSGLASSKLKVSKVLQKTYFEINENGTEAAAVTAIRVVAVSAKLEEQIITCDHPFLFYLMHKRNLVLFAGKFSDPRIERVNL